MSLAAGEQSMYGGGGGGDFLPMTPQFEASRRGLEDALAGSQAGITAERSLVDPWYQFMSERLGTDKRYADERLMQDLAERGLVGSGPEQFLRTRDIERPYGRAGQDLSIEAAQQLAALAQQEGGAGLEYNQGLMEALLNMAAQQSADMPYSLPGGEGRGQGRGRRRQRQGRGNRTRSRRKSRGRR
jgi:hypothetical protein